MLLISSWQKNVQKCFWSNQHIKFPVKLKTCACAFFVKSVGKTIANAIDFVMPKKVTFFVFFCNVVCWFFLVSVARTILWDAAVLASFCWFGCVLFYKAAMARSKKAAGNVRRISKRRRINKRSVRFSLRRLHWHMSNMCHPACTGSSTGTCRPGKARGPLRA